MSLTKDCTTNEGVSKVLQCTALQRISLNGMILESYESNICCIVYREANEIS